MFFMYLEGWMANQIGSMDFANFAQNRLIAKHHFRVVDF